MSSTRYHLKAQWADITAVWDDGYDSHALSIAFITSESLLSIIRRWSKHSSKEELQLIKDYISDELSSRN